MAKPSVHYQFGDSWCAGGFTLKELDGIVDLILSKFDVPAWPELLALGERESLTGFWHPLYQNWLNPSGARVQLDTEIAKRPGIELFKSRFKGKPLNLIKGQMIGPGTLKWSLLRKKMPIGDDDHIVDFLVESAIAQIQILSQFSWNVVLCLDEPAAGLCENTETLWREFFLRIDKYRPFGMALHCCGTPQAQWLEWPWQVVHLDAHEYLQAVEKKPADWQVYLRQFFGRGSWLVGGVVSANAIAIEPLDPMILNDFLDSVLPLSNRQLMFSTSCGIDCATRANLETRLDLIHKATEIAMQSVPRPSNARL